MQAERVLLEEEASARTQAERTAGALRRELERLRSTEEQRAAQARFAANHQARTELATEMDRVQDEHSRVVDELDRMRGTLLDHDSLLDEYSQRLHDEQEAQAKARAELLRAQEVQRIAERNLEIATETARRRAEDDHARLVKVEEELRDTVVERDRATTELLSLTTGDGEIARLRAQTAAAHEDMTRVLADLDTQAARADRAEGDLEIVREACAQAEQLAAEATEARDLAGITLETTRSELAERNELLDSERSAAQSRVADLSAQLATVTETSESATARVADLEAQLDAAVASRDDAVTRAAEYSDQLQRAVADAEQLRKHAASIGDELAATHVTLDEVRVELADALHPSPAPLDTVEGVATIDAIQVVEAAPSETQVEVAASGPSAFDVATASAFGETIDAPAPVEAPDAQPEFFVSGSAPTFVSGGAPTFVSGGAPTFVSGGAPTFRTVESKLARAAAGGPVVEREAALIRHVAPADPEPQAGDEEPDADGTPAEPETWRRTAMAEFSALAAGSDDLTPRRRR